jgi:hypothetical protein
MLALPIDKMLYICLLCPHSEHQNNPFQSKQSKHFHQRNHFTSCETDSNKIKLSKVVFNAIVLVPVGEEPNRIVIVLFKDNPSGLNMQTDSHWMKSQTPK